MPGRPTRTCRHCGRTGTHGYTVTPDGEQCTSLPACARRTARVVGAIAPPHRPSAQTPARMAKVLQNLALGNLVKTAAEAAGIPLPTYKYWMQEGNNYLTLLRTQDPDIEVRIADWAENRPLDTYAANSALWTDPAPDFIPDDTKPYWHRLLLPVLVQHARARAEADHVRVIRAAAANDWKASAWWLERSRPESFGRRLQHEGAPGGLPIQVQAVPSSEEVALRVAALAEERRRLASLESDSRSS